ncbi:GA module-containing protein [Mycoplasma corogypsi]|uniref:GA module-containing protein n=1 Tax=Mycoplasma corogypsi TaxID=2106 RepID=UPI00387319B0
MKNRKFRLILSAGVSLAIVPTMIAASCGSKATTEENTNSETSGDTSNTNADGGNNNTNPSEPTTPETDGKGKETKPAEPVVDPVTELNNEKTKGKNSVAALENLSATVKTSFDGKIDSATTKDGINTIVEEATQLNAATLNLVNEVETAKQSKESTASLNGTEKTTYEAKLAEAEALLDNKKLKSADTTKAKIDESITALKSAVTELKAYLSLTTLVAEVKTKLDEQTGENAVLVSTLKDSLLAHVNALVASNGTVSKKTTKAENIKRILESAKELQTVALESLTLRNEYSKKYYNASNKAEFDQALDKVLVLYPEYNFALEALTSAPQGENASNSRYWAPVRTTAQLQLVNYVKEEGEKVVKADDASFDTTAAVVSKLLNSLKSQKEALNGDSRNNSEAYFRNPYDYKLNWSNFLPHLQIENLPGLEIKLISTELTNLTKVGYYSEDQVISLEKVKTKKNELQTALDKWFANTENWKLLSDGLVKQLGAEKFNNVVLSSPKITFEYVMRKYGNSDADRRFYAFPIVTLTVAAANNSTLSSNTVTGNTISLRLRDLRNPKNPNNPLQFTWTYPDTNEAPNGNISDENLKAGWDVLNTFVEYNGPAIPVDASALVGQIGTTEDSANQTVNKTYAITNNEFNKSFRDWYWNGNNKFQNVVRNYINRYDNRFNATNSTTGNRGGIFTGYSNNNTRRTFWFITHKNDYDKLVLQQVKGDENAVYLALQGRTWDGWISTFLVRIPLTKFVKPVDTLAAAATTESQA